MAVASLYVCDVNVAWHDLSIAKVVAANKILFVKHTNGASGLINSDTHFRINNRVRILFLSLCHQ